jgi:arginine N-succinyltransferase
MLLIRDAGPGDLDAIAELAGYLNSVNLPADPEQLRAILTASEESFAASRDVADRRFVFVLADTATGRIHGTSMIFAQHGSRRAPHVYFDVLDEERYSQTLDRHVSHRVLRIGYNYKGLTEIGGLVVRPESRRHPEQLGKLLSHVRFLYIALHRSIFRDEVLSELMPPLEPDGTSLLWEALGRKFTGLSYQEADRLSRENKEFIRALFPEVPLYASLLPAEVQAVIGQVGPETKGVEKMLRRIGFEYAHRIDPFDGGPHFHARIDDVALVRRVVRARAVAAPTQGTGTLATASGVDPEAPVGAVGRCLLTAAGPTGEAAAFRATVSTASVTNGVIALDSEVLRQLGLTEGAEVAVLPVDDGGHASR